MRAIFFSLLAFVTFSVEAQIAVSPAPPVIQGFGPVAVPSSPALSVAPSNPATFSGAASSAMTAVAQLSALLTNLQNDLEVTLPLASAFNNNFDFVANASNGAPSPALPLGNNIAVTNSPGRPVTNVSIPNAAVLASTTNTFGVPPGFAVFPITRDTVRARFVVAR